MITDQASLVGPPSSLPHPALLVCLLACETLPTLSCESRCRRWAADKHRAGQAEVTVWCKFSLGLIDALVQKGIASST